jgi:hypothetical protein
MPEQTIPEYAPMMSRSVPRSLARALLMASLVAATGLPAQAAAAAQAAPQESVTEELIRLLADRLALSREEADRLIGRLREEQAEAQRLAAQSAAPAQSVATAERPPEPAGRVRVVYLSETEKQRIREDVRADVIATAEKDNWALPNSFPAWVKGLHVDGDIRLREEFDLLDGANADQFINFQAINNGSPVNTNPPAGQPLSFPVYNTTEDRQQPRIRARLGVRSDITEQLSAGFRFSTGNSTNPVSTNQTLGNDFNKLSFVVDRAWLNYRLTDALPLWGGRMPNPFFATELVWDDDLNFDGIAGQYRRDWSDRLRQDATVGVFSLYNTDFNYPGSSLDKESSRDKWLFGLQTGLEWRFSEEMSAKGALALYEFQDIEGELSSTCYAPNTSIACDTDNSRPQFMQKGNTLFALRDLVVLNPSDPTYQYFGLASPFRVLNLTGRVDRRLDDGMHLVIDADLALNLEYDEHAIEALVPVNNFGSCPVSDPTCTPPFEGGDFAWLVQGLVGHPRIAEAGQWNAIAGYRRLESDALPDGFTDSDFHLGGTNAKGYYLAGNYGIARNAWIGARWLSATEVSGAPLAIDVLQIDLNARF